MEPEGEIRGGANGCGQWVHAMVYLIASEASFLVCSMARIIYNYIYTCMFHAISRAVNVLKLMFLYTCIEISDQCDIPQCKSNINAQHANVASSMNWHNTQPRPPM